MESTKRRYAIYNELLDELLPVSATVLAVKFGVTRQIIVKDISILKAEGKEIISTTKGYVLKRKDGFRIRVNVCHNAECMEEELTAIVDLGGKVLNTFINHPVYGAIGETLNIKSRKDVKDFLLRISLEQCQPLLSLTKGSHSHVIEGDDEETLDEICIMLREKGFLSENPDDIEYDKASK